MRVGTCALRAGHCSLVAKSCVTPAASIENPQPIAGAGERPTLEAQPSGPVLTAVNERHRKAASMAAMSDAVSAVSGKSLTPLDVMKFLAGVLTPPAVFYAVGFLIMNAYVSATRLQASFWFTESFYREAGVTFLIDIVMSVAFAPHVFITLSALLIALFPGVTDGRSHQFGDRGFHFRLRVFADPVLRRRAFFAVVAAGAVLTIATLRDCNLFGCQLRDVPRWLLVDWWALGDDMVINWMSRRPYLHSSALFFAVSIPTSVALGMLTMRVLLAEFAGAAGGAMSAQSAASTAAVTQRETHPMAALVTASAFAVLAVFVPVGYGTFFYDFVAARIVPAERCISAPPKAGAPQTSGGGIDCYLLGRFETRYILIGREFVPLGQTLATDAGSVAPSDERRIYVKQVTDLEPFSILASDPLPVRSLIQLGSQP